MPGLILKCTHVDIDSDGMPSMVHCALSNEKRRATIHGLSKDNACSVEIFEPSPISSEEETESCLTVRHGYAEPSALETDGTWHFICYGYCTLDRKQKNRIILTASLKNFNT